MFALFFKEKKNGLRFQAYLRIEFTLTSRPILKKSNEIKKKKKKKKKKKNERRKKNE